MADRIGVSRSAYQKWEYGKRWPQAIHVEAISAIKTEWAEDQKGIEKAAERVGALGGQGEKG